VFLKKLIIKIKQPPLFNFISHPKFKIDNLAIVIAIFLCVTLHLLFLKVSLHLENGEVNSVWFDLKCEEETKIWC
jgi:hypothetical protein